MRALEQVSVATNQLPSDYIAYKCVWTAGVARHHRRDVKIDK